MSWDEVCLGSECAVYSSLHFCKLIFPVWWDYREVMQDNCIPSKELPLVRWGNFRKSCPLCLARGRGVREGGQKKVRLWFWDCFFSSKYSAYQHPHTLRYLFWARVFVGGRLGRIQSGLGSWWHPLLYLLQEHPTWVCLLKLYACSFEPFLTPPFWPLVHFLKPIHPTAEIFSGSCWSSVSGISIYW